MPRPSRTRDETCLQLLENDEPPPYCSIFHTAISPFNTANNEGTSEHLLVQPDVQFSQDCLPPYEVAVASQKGVYRPATLHQECTSTVHISGTQAPRQLEAPEEFNVMRSNERSLEGPLFHGPFTDKSVRSKFVRKVYGVWTCQMLATSVIVALFLYNPTLKFWTKGATLMAWIPVILAVVACCLMLLNQTVRRQTPFNVLWLVVFTQTESFLLGFISVYADTQSIFMMVALTAVVCLILTGFGDAIYHGIIVVCCCLVPLISFGIWSLLPQSDVDFDGSDLLAGSTNALLMTFFLGCSVRLITHGYRYCVLPHEYLYAAVSMYADWVTVMSVFTVIYFIMSFLLFNKL